MNRFLFYLFLCTAILCQGQQVDYVDFKKVSATVVFGDLKQKEVSGNAAIDFEILKNTDSIYLDARNFEKVRCVLNGKEVKVENNGLHIIIKQPFKAKSEHKLAITWLVKPKKAMYFIDWGFEAGNKQIWTQGQGKYTSHWLPSIDDMNDKIEFDLSFVFDEDYEVISNGKLIHKNSGSGLTTWRYDMQKPMSSYLVALTIGKYAKKTALSKSGIPLEMYYYPEDSLKFEPTYRYTKEMFDFLEAEIGVPYPWQNYKQIPVKDFLYAGMENTSTTIFSDSFVIDSIAFADKNYVNVNAHELAHQWFGNLVTETSGTHHWLQEGFATYYALLAEQSVFGNDYYYWQLYQYAQEVLEQDKRGESTSLLDPKSSSVTFYKKGALVLYLLHEKVGQKAFKKAIKSYLLKYQFNNVETDFFIKEVEKASGQDLSGFVNTWLVSKEFHYERVLENLKHSKFIVEYLDINCEAENSRCHEYVSSKISDEAKIKVIVQNSNLIKKEDFQNSLKVRQAIAIHLTEIPLELKLEYETLLQDASYMTIEKALFNLWMNFPQERHKYLNDTKGIKGFNDKNIRILWLTLALVTEDFESENTQSYFEELLSYTNPIFSFEIRQNAFLYLQEINACNTVCLENLKQATTHHSWQFSKFAKMILDQINTNK